MRISNSKMHVLVIVYIKTTTALFETILYVTLQKFLVNENCFTNYKFIFCFSFVTSQAKTFARNLRKYEWNFETGSCGNNIVIFLSRYDRQVIKKMFILVFIESPI